MKFSLKKKTMLTIILMVFFLSTVFILGARKGITDIIRKLYITKSEDLSYTIAQTVDTRALQKIREAVLEVYDHSELRVSNEEWDTPEYEAYMAQYAHIEASEEFVALQKWLRDVQDAIRVEYVYLFGVDIPRECIYYLVDASYEDNCPPGSFDYFTEQDSESMKTPEVGFAADITNTEEYGWLLAVGMPIRAEDGSIIAYAGVDVSMNDIMATRDHYLMILAGVMVLMAALVSAVGIALVNRFIIRPVNVLSEASVEYCDEESEETHHKFADLRIHTGDEIEALANSMVRMEQDINDHITSLLSTTRELITARERGVELDRLANIDALTRVRNKRAYDRETIRLNDEIIQGDARFGLVMIDMNGLKTLNDTYGHEKGDEGIKRLCAAVCDVFKHSPIFRIGGDEFVVVLEKHDLEEVDRLLAEFEESLALGGKDASARPWERVTAATGCAVYAPERDKSVEDVFKRADAAMYARKREMKKG